MVPRTFVVMDDFPRGPPGKSTEADSQDRGSSLRPSREPSTPMETALASIWSEILGTERVTAESDFFELGGQPLAAVRVVARIDAVLGVKLAANAVFECPTLESLAGHVDKSRKTWLTMPSYKAPNRTKCSEAGTMDNKLKGVPGALNEVWEGIPHDDTDGLPRRQVA